MTTAQWNRMREARREAAQRRQVAVTRRNVARMNQNLLLAESYFRNINLRLRSVELSVRFLGGGDK